MGRFCAGEPQSPCQKTFHQSRPAWLAGAMRGDLKEPIPPDNANLMSKGKLQINAPSKSLAASEFFRLQSVPDKAVRRTHL